MNKILTIIASPSFEVQSLIKKSVDKISESVLLMSVEDLLMTVRSMPTAGKVVFVDLAFFADPIASLKQLKMVSPIPEWVVLGKADTDLDLCREILSLGVFDVVLPPYNEESILKITEEASQKADTIQKLNQTILDPFLADFSSRQDVIRTLAKTRISAGQAPFSEEELYALFPMHERSLPEAKALFEELYGESWVEKIRPQKRIKVLAVDDEMGIRMSVEDVMRMGKFSPIMAESGAQAIELAKQNPDIDVLLLDIGLPDMTGIELLTQLREICPGAEAIMLTAYQDVSRMVKSFKGAAYTYLTKPFAQELLLTTVSKAAQRRYLHKTYDRYGKPSWGFLPEGMKLKLLRSLAERRVAQQDAFFMKDIYAFFPELKQSGIPGDTIISREKVMDGLLYVIEDLKKMVIY